MERIAIGSVKIVNVGRSEKYETIECRIEASMIDYKVNENDNSRVIDGSRDRTNFFTEYWTFMRANGVKTNEDPSISTRKCPNCGAPLDINESGECKYCKANVVSGNFDWVLSSISQEK